MLTFLILGCGVLGLAVGSFLNVVIWRVPRGESLVRPRSHCPSCDAELKERDNIPVVSWLLLRGRCRSCGVPISKRYPLVELACAALFAGTAARFGLRWDLPAFLVLFAALLALSAIDLDLHLLPRAIIYPSLLMVAALLVLAAAMGLGWRHLMIGAGCAAGWFALFFLINLLSPRMLGFGDVRLSALLGLSLGWLGFGYVLLGFFAANLVGALIGISLLATKRMRREDPLPFGVFLSIGTALAVFTGPELLTAFSHLG
jgi:leader peptidase (prepilin peptidase)/N-methyltransferase